MRNRWSALLGVATVLFVALATHGTAQAGASGDKAAQITFSGKVLDAKGQPVAGARMILYQVSYEESADSPNVTVAGEKTTGTDGQYAFAAAKDSEAYREGCMLVQKEGLALGWAVWRMREDQQSDITLGEPKELAGEVVDENSKPIADAEVSIALTIIGKEEDRRYFPNYWMASDFLAVKADGNGRFVFSNLPAEAGCELLAKSLGRATICTYDSSARQDNSSQLQFAPGKSGIKLTLPPEARVRGAVVEKAGGRPVGGLKLAVQPDQRGLPLPQGLLVSAEDGSFSVGSLAPGAYTVQLASRADKVADWVAEPVGVSLKAGETKSDIKLELVKGGIVEMLVKEGVTGKPIEKASVSLRPSERDQWTGSQTDPNGLARVRVTPGTYAISGAYKQGYSGQRQQEQIEINDGETKRLEYTLTASPRIAGTVRDEAGNPLASVKVEIKPSSPEEKTTGSDGRFEVSWDPSNWGPAGTTFVLVARDPARNLAATADIDEQVKSLDLKLRPGVVFTGKVLNHEGTPRGGAHIRVMLRVGNWGSTLGRSDEITTAQDGTFEAKAIPQERQYGVTATAEGYGKFEVQADAANAKDNRVELGEFKLPLADQSVSGVVVDANDKPVPGARIYAYGENQPDSRDIQTDNEGKFVIKNVCAGPIRLNANAPGPNGLYGYAQTEGGATDVTIVVSERSSGQVFIPKKPQPLAGKPLPNLKSVGVELPPEANDRMVLVCLWDMNQRPSRHIVTQLAQQASQLSEKGVTIVAIQAAKGDAATLAQWVEKNKTTFKTGSLTDDFEKARFNWGATSLPHLILTDKKHIVVAEGFGLSELDAKIQAAAGQ